MSVFNLFTPIHVHSCAFVPIQLHSLSFTSVQVPLYQLPVTRLLGTFILFGFKVAQGVDIRELDSIRHYC